jgi:hypothetical protein
LKNTSAWLLLIEREAEASLTHQIFFVLTSEEMLDTKVFNDVAFVMTSCSDGYGGSCG